MPDEVAVQELVNLLAEVHPQVLLSAFLKAEDGDTAIFFLMLKTASDELAIHAGKIFAQLPFKRQVGIAEKVITTEIIESERAKQLWNEFVAKIKEALQQTTFLGDGTANLAKLLTHTDIESQNRLLQALAGKHPELVKSVSEKLFTFDELASLGDEAIDTILKVLDSATLALALHNAPEAIVERFFANMSASQTEAVTTEREQLTFEKTQIAETARHSLVSLVRNFAAKGLLKI